MWFGDDTHSEGVRIHSPGRPVVEVEIHVEFQRLIFVVIGDSVP